VCHEWTPFCDILDFLMRTDAIAIATLEPYAVPVHLIAEGPRQKNVPGSFNIAICARAASGNVAVAPPSSVMNSRRFS
jgi:hypothetical protein